MDFKDAINAMKEGKKVRKPSFEGYMYVQGNDQERYGEIINIDKFGKEIKFFMAGWVFDTDWQIVEEKNTLSDKINDKGCLCECKKSIGTIRKEDVKEAIIGFLGDMRELVINYKMPLLTENIDKLSKGRFGDKLTKG